MRMETHIIEFVPANGFVSESYQAFFDAFPPIYRVQYLSLYGHAPSCGSFKDWDCLTDQLLAHLHTTTPHGKKVIGIGHSMGGVLLLRAYLKSPEKFSQLFLVDAPIFHPVKQWLLYLAQRLGVIGYGLTPARKSRKRESHWRSKEAMRQYLTTKAFFRNFSPAALQHYIEHGTKKTERGVSLRFSPAVEYEIFKNVPALFGGVSVSIPAHYLHATQHSVLKKVDINFLMRNMVGMTFVSYPGGHLFPLEAPAAAASLVQSLVRKGAGCVGSSE